ncbi:MAG: hypothetical protein ABOK23_06885 [Candidatus Methanoperedens sp.]|nr:hypothetical protein [Candidatus Methanoperedens sp.]
MAVYKTKDIESALSRKGFQVHHSKHKIYILYVDGKKTNIFTFVSHGIKEYGNPLLSKMKRQLHLSGNQFDDLVSCPLSYERLVEIYTEQNLI